MKTCPKCGETKPADEFSKCRRAQDGLQFQCKACDAAYNKAYRAANAEEIAARQKEWRATHADRIADRMKEWRAESREEIAVYNAAYHADHADEIAVRAKAWRKANPDYDKEYRIGHSREAAAQHKAWRKANPEKVAATEHRRRARQVNATVEDFDILAVWERDDYTCVYCGATEGLSIDHIVPLFSGGAHSPDNLCVACRRCNSSKCARPLIDWLATTNKLDVLEQGALL